jgi:predicted nucleic acid-binding Zn ribbon protein
MRKLMFPVGVIYKGSGFYTTDYARKGSTSGDDGNGKKDSKLDGKSKPATATKES